MHPFPTPWKHQKTVRCFQGVEKGCIGNEWVKLNDEDIRKMCKTCSEWKIETPKRCLSDVVLMSLLWTLNRFHTFWCCHHWLGTSKYQLGRLFNGFACLAICFVRKIPAASLSYHIKLCLLFNSLGTNVPII